MQLSWLIPITNQWMDRKINPIDVAIIKFRAQLIVDYFSTDPAAPMIPLAKSESFINNVNNILRCLRFTRKQCSYALH